MLRRTLPLTAFLTATAHVESWAEREALAKFSHEIPAIEALARDAQGLNQSLNRKTVQATDQRKADKVCRRLPWLMG